MLARALNILKYIFTELGPLVVFWGLDLTVGLKPAIAGSIVFIVGDGIWRLWKRLSFTRLYILVSVLTLVFGAIDLVSENPFMLKYEAVITNVVTGGAFLLGARGKRSLVQELAEQRSGESYGDQPDIALFFKFFTLLWAAYFLVKAAFYLFIGSIMPMEEAMAVRSVVGTASMFAMMALSVTQGERLFDWCKRLGWLPEGKDSAEGEAQA